MRPAVISLLFFAAFHTPANAYLDPGTGSMILQALIGGIAIGAATISAYWQRIKALVSKRSRSK
jgi:hypothetical protein